MCLMIFIIQETGVIINPVIMTEYANYFVGLKTVISFAFIE